MRLPTYDKPRIIACAEDHPKHVALPRGCLDDVKGLLSDLKVPILIKDKRQQGQSLNVSFQGELRPDQNEAVGYSIQLPASAVPGWPTEIPLPVDPMWKSQYAASVPRLVRDGVDLPLANLFVHTASPFTPDAEGTSRARSASEAFLHRRLESLPETAGRFRLNAELPIPFDGWGKMEVDLLCSQARLAVEIDGGQHLSDADAYRRDRRKDALLQENGYIVLRFLAEDMGKRLDEVLDAILRALSRRRNHSLPILASAPNSFSMPRPEPISFPH